MKRILLLTFGCLIAFPAISQTGFTDVLESWKFAKQTTAPITLEWKGYARLVIEPVDTAVWVYTITRARKTTTVPPVAAPLTIEFEGFDPALSSSVVKVGSYAVPVGTSGVLGFANIKYGPVDYKEITFKYSLKETPNAVIKIVFGSATSPATTALTFSLPPTNDWTVYKTFTATLPVGINSTKTTFFLSSRGLNLDSVTLK